MGSLKYAVWLEGACDGNIILPLILIGVETVDGVVVSSMHYTIWSQDKATIEEYVERLHRVMGWDINTPYDPIAISIAKKGARLLRGAYITLWDQLFPTLHLERYGCNNRRRLRELIAAMPVPPPFIAHSPWIG